VTKSLRFSAEEWATVNEKVAGRDFSSVVRAILLTQEIPEPKHLVRREIVRRQMSAYEAEKIRHIAYFGSNLNQLARAANQGKGFAQVYPALLSLEREMRRFAE
jgi:hypothetical protein